MQELKTRPEWIESVQSPWGTSVAIDCYNCNAKTIRSEDEIKRFTAELIDLIDMKAFGPCHVVHFGEEERVAGYSMFQLIETSCISAHFANLTETAYIDVFSCKSFSHEAAAKFCQDFFSAKKINVHIKDRW